MGRTIINTLLLAGLLVSGNAVADQADTFIAASVMQTETPDYPQDRRAEKRESSLDDGLVELRFMVDETGNATNPVVVRASLERFIEPALSALEKFSYKPATLNGKAVPSVATHTLKFHVSPADLRSSRGVQSTFASLRDEGVPDGYQSFYDKFTKEMARREPAQAKAARHLEKMIELKHQSFYSLAYHSLARFRLSDRFGDAAESINALNDLIWFDPYVEEKHRVLTEETKSGIWANLLKLQIESGYYAEALETYSRFNSFDTEGAAPFTQYIDKILLLKSSEQATQREIAINQYGNTDLPLLKTAFMFADVNGKIGKVVLRCTKRFAELEFVADSKYELPPSWGQCYLQLAGEPNTTAVMLEQ